MSRSLIPTIEGLRKLAQSPTAMPYLLERYGLPLPLPPPWRDEAMRCIRCGQGDDGHDRISCPECRRPGAEVTLEMVPDPAPGVVSFQCRRCRGSGFVMRCRTIEGEVVSRG